jgi:hypothetical protein
MTNKRKWLGISVIVLVFSLFFASCTTYRPVDVTNTQAAQINTMSLYELTPGDVVQTLYLKRTGSVIRDLNAYQRGSWYAVHQDKIVNVEAVIKRTRPFGKAKEQWRIEYVK